MNNVKKIPMVIVRFLLVILAPEFAYSQSVRRKLPGPAIANAGSEDVQRQQVGKEKYPNEEMHMNESIVTYRGAVYPWQCDHMGHMNVMWYVGKFDEASWQLLSRLGVNRSRFYKEGAGAVTLEQRIDYKRELYAGDLITIRSRVLEINEKTIRVTHEMTNDETGEVSAITTILGLYIDARLRKACPVPDDVRERMKLLLAGSDGPDDAISADARVEQMATTGPVI